MSDPTKPDELDRGLFPKYIVHKIADGSPVTDFFVLRPDKDPYALHALRAYADSLPTCKLRDDLDKWTSRLMSCGVNVRRD